MYWETEKEVGGGGGTVQSKEGAQHQEQCSGEHTVLCEYISVNVLSIYATMCVRVRVLRSVCICG